MSCKRALLASLLAALPEIAHAQMRRRRCAGNTVVVTWVEDKNQRIVGATDFRQEHLNFSTSFYIDTAGQLLRLRFSNVASGRSRDYMAVGRNVSTRFRGRSLEMTAAVNSGAARKL